jgi:hypothetical protein
LAEIIVPVLTLLLDLPCTREVVLPRLPLETLLLVAVVRLVSTPVAAPPRIILGSAGLDHLTLLGLIVPPLAILLVLCCATLGVAV